MDHLWKIYEDFMEKLLTYNPQSPHMLMWLPS
jgi:hypothetical protein